MQPQNSLQVGFFDALVLPTTAHLVVHQQANLTQLHTKDKCKTYIFPHVNPSPYLRRIFWITKKHICTTFCNRNIQCITGVFMTLVSIRLLPDTVPHSEQPAVSSQHCVKTCNVRLGQRVTQNIVKLVLRKISDFMVYLHKCSH